MKEFEYIIKKIDEISNDTKNIKAEQIAQGLTLVKQEEQLRYHIKRTDLSEENIKLLREEFKPVKQHVTRVETILKFVLKSVALVSVVLGIVLALTKLF